MLRKKREWRLDDESIEPLASYRARERERMRVNFFGPGPTNYEARRRFVFKRNPPPQGSRAPVRTAVECPLGPLTASGPGALWCRVLFVTGSPARD